MEIVDALTDRLRVLMRTHGVKAAPLPDAAALNESAVRDILRGRSKNPEIVTLQKIASVLKLRPNALFEARQAWFVVGTARSNGEIVEFERAGAERKAIENPFFEFRDERMEAFEVRGAALEPYAYDGDYLIAPLRDCGVAPEDYGRPCILLLADGRRLVRRPVPGEARDRYHLAPIGLYTRPEIDAEVLAAAPVVIVLPKRLVPEPPPPSHKASREIQ